MKVFKISIVDDDEISSKILITNLTKLGFEVDYFISGEAFLESLIDHTPDLVLLDVMMPGLSGMGVLKNVRERFSSVELPIIMLTAKQEASDIVDALQAGANDYITKPANLEVATARIKTQVDLKRYYKESIRKKEVETLNSMIVTLNHEINNPLAIAMISLKPSLSEMNEEKLKMATNSIHRIAKIVSSIKGIVANNLQYSGYADGHKLIKLKKSN